MLNDDLARMLIEEHPLDTARVLERLEPAQVWQFLKDLDQDLRPPIIEGFNRDYAARVLLEADNENLTALIRDLPSEVSADILEYVPDEIRTVLLRRIAKASRRRN